MGSRGASSKSNNNKKINLIKEPIIKYRDHRNKLIKTNLDEYIDELLVKGYQKTIIEGKQGVSISKNLSRLPLYKRENLKYLARNTNLVEVLKKRGLSNLASVIDKEY